MAKEFKFTFSHEPSLIFSRKIQNAMYPQEKGATSEAIVLEKLERKKLDRMIEILSHPNLHQAIEDGYVTLGAIKPKANVSKLETSDDTEAERMIIERVKPPLEVVFTFSLNLHPEDVASFYPQSVADKINKMEGPKGWEYFVKYMTSGPVTYLMLYDPNGDAVAEWRRQIGSTDPRNADPESIRGKYAKRLGRNLVHGSSGDNKREAVKNVKKELNWLKDKLEFIAASIDEESQQLPNEKKLREAELLTEGQEFVSINLIKRGGEASYAIVYKDRGGRYRIKHISEEALKLAIEDELEVSSGFA